jgi:hypothetical protein
VVLAANDHARPGHPTVPSTRLAKPDAAAVSWTDHDVESNRYDWARCSAFRQQDWSLPVQPPTPGNPITWRQTVMLGQDVLPFRQRDWPLPPLHALPRIDLSVARSPTRMLFQDVLPFRQTDWPLPALHTFPRIDPTFISGFTVVLEGQVIRVPPPFTNYDWPVPLGQQMRFQPDRAVMSSPGINLLHRHRHHRHSSPYGS